VRPCTRAAATTTKALMSTPKKRVRLARKPNAGPKKKAKAASKPKKKAKTSGTRSAAEDGFEVAMYESPHTLVCGTFPSVKSLKNTEYYGHERNAFWHTAGEHFGFRRDLGTNLNDRIAKGTYAGIVLLPKTLASPAITYDAQMEILLKNGFALWDVLSRCERPGSLDSSIRHKGADFWFADIEGLVKKTPSIKRICFTSGCTSFKEFCKLKSNKAWLKEPGAFRCDPKDDRTITMFKDRKWLRHIVKETSEDAIVVCCLVSISPSMTMTYPDKRKEWLKLCWCPSPL